MSTLTTHPSTTTSRSGPARVLRDVLRRIVTNPTTALGVTLLVLIVLAVLVGPLLWPADPNAQDLVARNAAPSWAHPLGTDSLGRDTLSRLLVGGRSSLGITALAVAASGLGGAAVGLTAGFLGGWVDAALMRLCDVFLALPFLLLALMISVTLGPGVVNTVIALTLPAIPRDARLIRAAVITVRQADYVFAAKAAGVRPWRIATRHVLRNCVGIVVTVLCVGVAYTLLAVAGLGFLGLGVQPPDPEWGAMLTDAQTSMMSNPVAALAPGVAVLLTALAANWCGDGLGDLTEPVR
ncbi:ABC transporter permease [Kribbella sp. NPDC048915]|uniref:ABC transporter permease n=1 Tax=Kribbella sp. NPDC048915 TaxID=3155148 RepID=UPI0033CD82D6